MKALNEGQLFFILDLNNNCDIVNNINDYYVNRPYVIATLSSKERNTMIDVTTGKFITYSNTGEYDEYFISTEVNGLSYVGCMRISEEEANRLVEMRNSDLYEKRLEYIERFSKLLFNSEAAKNYLAKSGSLIRK